MLKKFLWICLLLSIHSISSLAFAAPTHELCAPPKTKDLDMDQRDDWRLACLKKKSDQIKVSQCLAITHSMEYSNNAEEGRVLCMNLPRDPLNAKACLQIAETMEYPDSGDEVRWECLRRFGKTLSIKQCGQLVESMNYPANSQRASLFCKQRPNF